MAFGYYLSRLLEADHNSGPMVYSYGYDPAGNLVRMNGVTRTYNAANQMTHDGTNALTYDANGNLTSDGVNTYTWDRANRMIQVDTGTPAELTAYAYDGLNNRISQAIGTSSPVVTEYLNDTQPGLTKVLAQTTGANTDHFVHGPRGIHAMEDHTGDWSYMAQDGLGSVRTIIDNTLNVDAVQTYDPIGNPMGSYDADFGFTGEQTDDTGQIYLRARYYDPSIGTFTALDPFEGMMDRPMSLNGYSWVEGNTPNATDPFGLCSNTQPRFLRPRCRELARSLSSRYNIPLENLINENFEDLLAFEAAARLNDAAIIPNLIREYGFERPLEVFPDLWQEGLENENGYTASGNLEALWEGRELWLAVVYEPADWALTAQRWSCGDFEPIDLLILTPLASSAFTRGVNTATDNIGMLIASGNPVAEVRGITTIDTNVDLADVFSDMLLRQNTPPFEEHALVRLRMDLPADHAWSAIAGEDFLVSGGQYGIDWTRQAINGELPIDILYAHTHPPRSLIPGEEYFWPSYQDLDFLRLNGLGDGSLIVTGTSAQPEVYLFLVDGDRTNPIDVTNWFYQRGNRP